MLCAGAGDADLPLADAAAVDPLFPVPFPFPNPMSMSCRRAFNSPISDLDLRFKILICKLK